MVALGELDIEGMEIMRDVRSYVAKHNGVDMMDD